MTNDVLIKLSSRVPQSCSLDGHADGFYNNLGKHYVAIVEFRVADRTEVDPDSDASPKVKLEFGSFEVAYDGEDEAHVRTLMQELYRTRTADGTFDQIQPTGEVVREATDESAPIPITGAGKRPRGGGGGRG